MRLCVFVWVDVLLKGLSSLDFCIPRILMGEDESYVKRSSGHTPNPAHSAANLCVCVCLDLIQVCLSKGILKPKAEREE